jgi:hypothetical protein
MKGIQAEQSAIRAFGDGSKSSVSVRFVVRQVFAIEAANALAFLFSVRRTVIDEI